MAEEWKKENLIFHRGLLLKINMLTKSDNLKGYTQRGFGFMRKIQCSEILIKNAIHDEWIRELSFYFLVKARLRNSILYNYNHRKSKIARLLRISPKTLERSSEMLLRKNLAVYQKHHLLIRSIHQIKKDLKEKWACTLHLPEGVNLKQIEYRLYLKHIHVRARQQLKKERKAMNDHRKAGIRDVISEPPFFGYRFLARELNCSRKKVESILAYLKEANLIETKVISKKVGKTSLKEIVPKYWPELGYPYINRKNELIIIYGTHFKFKQHFVKL